MLKKLSALQPYALSVMRIMIGFTFLLHGLQKAIGGIPGIRGQGFPPGSLLWTAGMIELIGGSLIILGLFTIPVSFILSGEMAVAYFRAHAPRGPWPIMDAGNDGEIAVMYCFIFLYLFTSGGGAWSLDRLLFRKK
jgi:putative oxidoreductase